MEQMKVLSLGAKLGMYRKVVIRISPTFWGIPFSLWTHDVDYYGNERVWFKWSLCGPCTDEKTTGIINQLIAEFEASIEPT